MPCQDYSNLYGESRLRYNDPDPNAARTVRVEFGLYDAAHVEQSYRNFLAKRVEFEEYCSQRCGGPVRITEVVLSCWILTAQWHQKGLMYGVENRFKMLLLLGLKRPHCGMRFQQPSTTSVKPVEEHDIDVTEIANRFTRKTHHFMI